jgi:acetyl esterase/lipase
MTKHALRSAAFIIAALLTFPQSSGGKTSGSFTPKEFRDITYLSVDGTDLKLDVYQASSKSPSPVLIFFHGGGWVSNSRPKTWTGFRFYLSKGFSVINVDYRLAADAKAPAAVQDCRAALAWTGIHAKEYGFDVSRIVVCGTSAGGHLAMMTGIVPRGADFDIPMCGTMPKAAAVIDFYGIADVQDLLSGANKRGWANTWIGNVPGRESLAEKMSPIKYITKDTPPVIIIHGDSDPTVPYRHALRLAETCGKHGVRYRLVTVKGGQHGKFGRIETENIENEIDAFLRGNGIIR